MPTVAEIQAAARKLPVKHRTDLLEHFAQDPAIQTEQLARLRAAVEAGMRDHTEGRFIEINSAAEHRAFFDDIKRRGRARLSAKLKKSA
jgi:predicted transcriptional regulator